MSKKEKKEVSLTLKQITTSPAAPLIENGVYKFRAEFISNEATVDGAQLYIFHSGYKVVIPAGYLGLFITDDSVASSSLISSTGTRIIEPGVETDLFIPYRLTTVSAPALFKVHQYKNEGKEEEEGSYFAKLILVPITEAPIDIIVDKPERPAEADKAEANTTAESDGVINSKPVEEMYSTSDAEFEEVEA